MTEAVISFFSKFFSAKTVTFFIAMLPVSELRGAIPFAWASQVPAVEAYAIAVLGNMVPVLPLLLFLGPASNYLQRFRWGDKFFTWLFRRTRSRSEIVRKYETLGLVMFVAIPLPITGAWTGTVAAFLFGLELRRAFVAITCGVLIAGIVVSAASFGLKELYLYVSALRLFS